MKNTQYFLHKTTKSPKNSIEKTVSTILTTLQQAHEELSNIKADIKNQIKDLEKKLKSIKTEYQNTIKQVDKLQKEYNLARFELVNITSNYDKYSHQQQRQAYEHADSIRVMLAQAKEREKLLRKQRDMLEIELKSLNKLYKKAEKIESKTRMAIELISSATEEEALKKLLPEEKDSLQKLLIFAIEEERKRIARELHDYIAQQLLASSLKSELIIKLISQNRIKEALAETQDVVNSLRNTALEIRKLIFNLKSGPLEKENIIDYIKNYTQRLSKEYNVDIIFNFEGDKKSLDKLGYQKKINIARLIQEGIMNAIKHSKSKEIIVNFSADNKKLNIEIIDKGVGFDINKIKADQFGENTYGLSNMEERAKLIGAKLNIITALGKGTKVILEIPKEEV